MTTSEQEFLILASIKTLSSYHLQTTPSQRPGHTHKPTPTCSLEMLDALVHDLEGIVDGVGEEFRVHVHQGIMHPGLVPLLPVSSRQPHVLVWLELTSQLRDFVVLQ